MRVKVIKTADNINFINPIKTTLIDLLQCKELSMQYILCEYLDIIEGSIVLYAYSNSLKDLDTYIKNNTAKHKYYTVKIPENCSMDCLEGIY